MGDGLGDVGGVGIDDNLVEGASERIALRHAVNRPVGESVRDGEGRGALQVARRAVVRRRGAKPPLRLAAHDDGRVTVRIVEERARQRTADAA